MRASKSVTWSLNRSCWRQRVWLDSFAAACEEQGRDYLDRVRYLMGDYSPHVPTASCSSPTCNVYDNLPTDEVMRVGDHAYEPLVRASITPKEMAELSARHGIAQDEIVTVVQRVLREGPESRGDLAAGVQCRTAAAAR